MRLFLKTIVTATDLTCSQSNVKKLRNNFKASFVACNKCQPTKGMGGRPSPPAGGCTKHLFEKQLKTVVVVLGVDRGEFSFDSFLCLVDKEKNVIMLNNGYSSKLMFLLLFADKHINLWIVTKRKRCKK